MDKVLLPLQDVPPSFDEINGNIVDFIRNVNDYKIISQKKRYDILLIIFSKIFNKSITSLTEIKNMKCDKVNIFNILNENSESINKEFNNILINHKEVNVNILKKLCETINYKLIIKNDYYTIKK